MEFSNAENMFKIEVETKNTSGIRACHANIGVIYEGVGDDVQGDYKIHMVRLNENNVIIIGGDHGGFRLVKVNALGRRWQLFQGKLHLENE